MNLSSIIDERNKPMKIRRGPCGVHIIDRRSGLNILLDEVKLPAVKWDRAPRHVSIALTNACDLSCPFCYAPKNTASLNRYRLLTWIDELDANGCAGVGFGGGEPTLYRHLPELCRHITHRTSMAATLTTHGHLLDDERLVALAGNIHFVRISVDGIGKTYERLRGRPFQSLVRRLELIRKLFRFGINFVVNTLTVSDLDAAVELATSFGAAELLLLPEIPTPKSAGIDERTAAELA